MCIYAYLLLPDFSGQNTGYFWLHARDHRLARRKKYKIHVYTVDANRELQHMRV